MDKSIEPTNDLARELERVKSFPSTPELRVVNSEHPLPDPFDDEYTVYHYVDDSDSTTFKPSSLEDEYIDEGYLYALDAYDNMDEHDLLDDCDDAGILYRGPGN